MKLSIGMMVKNEANNLERCLTSLQPLLKSVSSELIIVDTGSTDNTVEIARKFTDKIYFHPWENDYSKMRNYTVNYSQGEWFFFVDADEELVEYKDIVEFLSTNKSTQYNAAFVKINNFFRTDDQSQYGTALVGRLFRRTESFRFQGVVHEEPSFEPPIIWLNALLVHYGYVNNDPELKARKFALYESLLAQALEKDPENVGYWYYLAQTYGTYKDQKEALRPAIKAYEIVKKKKLKPAKYIHIYITLASLYLVNGNLVKTEEIAEEGLRYKEWSIDLWYNLAKAQAMLKKTEKAIQSYKKYLYYLEHHDKYAGEDTKIISSSITKEEEVHLDLSFLYKECDDILSAVDELKKINSRNVVLNAIPHALNMFLDLNQYDELKDYYRSIRQLGDADLDKSFINVLENLLINTFTTKQEQVHKLFVDEPTIYGLLNRIRVIGEKESVSTQLIDKINELNLNQLEDYYGDIFYFLIQKHLSLKLIDTAISEEKLEALFRYLTHKYGDISPLFYDYLKNRKEEFVEGEGFSLEEIRIHKFLQRIILMYDSLEGDEYEWILDCYIRDGINYIRQIYQEEILNGGMQHLLSREEAFFMYLNLAKSSEKENEAEYVRNLKKALLAYPEMKKGIQILLNRLTKQAAFQPALSDEMKAYARIVKENIHQFIQKGLFNEAMEIILGYEEIIPNDPDISGLKIEINSLRNKKAL